MIRCIMMEILCELKLIITAVFWGGITNGMPVVFKVGFKPTPSISLPQKTINVSEHTNTVLEIKGRHDPCIVQRAVPVVEGVTAWTVLDMLLTADIDGEV